MRVPLLCAIFKHTHNHYIPFSVSPSKSSSNHLRSVLGDSDCVSDDCAQSCSALALSEADIQIKADRSYFSSCKLRKTVSLMNSNAKTAFTRSLLGLCEPLKEPRSLDQHLVFPNSLQTSICIFLPLQERVLLHQICII